MIEVTIILSFFYFPFPWTTVELRMTGVTPGAKDPGRVDEKHSPLRHRQEGQRLHADLAKASS